MALLVTRQAAQRDWLRTLARVGIGLLVVVATALLWLLILTYWVEAASRSVSPVS
jgi:hypothetical protein